MAHPKQCREVPAEEEDESFPSISQYVQSLNGLDENQEKLKKS